MRDIMRRVSFIHAGRIFLSPGMIKAIVFFASCVSMLLIVSVTHVLENMSHLPHLMAYFSYVSDAYLHTSWSVQSVVALAVVAGLWLVGDIARNLKFGRLLRFGGIFHGVRA